MNEPFKQFKVSLQILVGLTLCIQSACSFQVSQDTPPPATITSTELMLPTTLPSSTPIPGKASSTTSFTTPSPFTPTYTSDPPYTKVPAITPKPSDGSIQGRISFPFRYADAGNFTLQAGATINLTWDNAPRDAISYEFQFAHQDQAEPITIGLDENASDGISIDWTVPENLLGEFQATAKFADDRVVQAAWSGSIYSGEAPPVGICTMSSGNIGVVNLFQERNRDTMSFAYLVPGPYAEVLERTTDGWYLIDARVALDKESQQAAVGTGWVDDSQAPSFHGPCDDVPVISN